MHRLESWPQELFVEDLLDLLVSVCKNSVNSHCQLGRNIVWHLISSSTVLPFSEDRLATKFIELLKLTLERGTASDIEVYFDKAVNLIERKPDLSITLLKRMFGFYPECEIDSP